MISYTVNNSDITSGLGPVESDIPVNIKSSGSQSRQNLLRISWAEIENSDIEFE